MPTPVPPSLSVTPPEAIENDDDRFDAYDDEAPADRAVSGKRGGHGGRTRFQRTFIHMRNRLHREGYC